MKSDTITLPVYWASYLINGDASGLNEGEQEHIDAYLEGCEGRIVDMVEDSERFTWSFDLYGGQCRGGDVADYVVLI